MKLNDEALARLSAQWRVKTDGPIVRLSRHSAATPLEDGTVPPDLPIGGRLVLQLAKNDGEKVQPFDDKGRLHLRAYILNPHEVVEWGGMRFRIAADAVTASLERFSEHPRMFGHHNPQVTIGDWSEMGPTADGLFGRGFISSGARNTMYGDFQQLSLDGVLSCSAGLFFREAEFNQELDLLDVAAADLEEVSLVGKPAVRSAFIETVAALAAAPSTPCPPTVQTELDLPAPVIDFGPALRAALNGAVVASRTIAETATALGVTEAASGGREAE